MTVTELVTRRRFVACGRGSLTGGGDWVARYKPVAASG